MALQLVAPKNKYDDMMEAGLAASLREEKRLVNRAKRFGKGLYKVFDCFIGYPITSRIKDYRDKRPKANFSKPKLTRLILATKYAFDDETYFLGINTEIVYPRHLAGGKVKLSLLPTEITSFKPVLFGGQAWLDGRLDPEDPIRGRIEASVSLNFLSDVYEDLRKARPLPPDCAQYYQDPSLYINIDLSWKYSFGDISGVRLLWVKNLFIRNPKTRKRFYCRAAAR